MKEDRMGIVNINAEILEDERLWAVFHDIRFQPVAVEFNPWDNLYKYKGTSPYFNRRMAGQALQEYNIIGESDVLGKSHWSVNVPTDSMCIA